MYSSLPEFVNLEVAIRRFPFESIHWRIDYDRGHEPKLTVAELAYSVKVDIP
jgi:hypothetical protein